MINPFWKQQQAAIGDNRLYSQGFLQDLAGGIEKLFGGGLNSVSPQEYSALQSSGFSSRYCRQLWKISLEWVINQSQGINQSSGFLQDLAGGVESIFGMGINQSSGICSSCGFDHEELKEDFEQILDSIKNNRTLSIEDDSIDNLKKKFDIVVCYSFKKQINTTTIFIASRCSRYD